MIRHLALALFALLFASTGAFGQAIPAGGKLQFAFLRDGVQIGTHLFTFRREGGQVMVDNKVDVAVKFAFFTLYRYHRKSREIWQDGNVVGYHSTTDDDGDLIEVNVHKNSHNLIVDGADGRRSVPLGTMVSGYWSADTVGQTLLIDSAIGRIVKVRTKSQGKDVVSIDGRDVTAHYYQMTGDLDRELWYDAAGFLLAGC